MDVEVVVPSGIDAGMPVEFYAPDGQLLTATVPDGMCEGDTFVVNIPPAPPWLDELLSALTHANFERVLSGFVDTNCDKFTFAGAQGGAYTLEHTDIHNKYQRFYESRIETYLKRIHVTQDELCAALVAARRKDSLIDSLPSVQDFEGFCRMMQQRALEKDMG
jgi:hypothetical protein